MVSLCVPTTRAWPHACMNVCLPTVFIAFFFLTLLLFFYVDSLANIRSYFPSLDNSYSLFSPTSSSCIRQYLLGALCVSLSKSACICISLHLSDGLRRAGTRPVSFSTVLCRFCISKSRVTHNCYCFSAVPCFFCECEAPKPTR